MTMRVYIFPQLWDLTHAYHPGGGLVVVAKSPERARALIRAEAPSDEERFPDREVRAALADELDFRSAITYPTDKEVEAVFVFPDSGCC